jgi:oligosaccharide repeat unit polymerase
VINSNILINKNKVVISTLFVLLLVIGALYALIFSLVTPVLIFILIMVLTGYFFIEKKIILFNPFTLFTLYFYTVVFASIYLYLSDFENSIYINNQNFSTPIPELFNITIAYIIICYIFAYLGYKTFINKFTPKIDLYNDGISIKILNIVIIIFIIIGLSNFYFNVLKFAGGSLFLYMENMALRYAEFKYIGGTTIGYLFAYTAGYMWLYRSFKLNKKISPVLIIYILITIIMKASTGRILGTLFYLLSYVLIYYFIYFDTQSKKHKKYFLVLFLIPFLGISLYFFRGASSVGFEVSMLDSISLNTIMYYLVDKGNVPNLTVLMKVIDGWGDGMPFLYGKSLFTWVYDIIPSEFRPAAYQPSVMIKQVWYPHIEGGNLPPTGMGEMFANFWYFGSVFGMYLFGVFSAFIYNLLNKFNNYFYLVVYSNITLGFIFIYPKGEFDNLSLWAILPIGLTYLLVRFLTILLRKKVESKN